MKKMNLHCFRLAVFVISIMLVQNSFACTVNATEFQFGSIDPLRSRDTLSSSNITVDCPAPTSYSISLSAGSGSYSERQMLSGNSQLAYNLYLDSANSTVWGDGTGISQLLSGSADSAGVMHTVYGRIPHQPAAVPGSYTDTIVVTLSF